MQLTLILLAQYSFFPSLNEVRWPGKKLAGHENSHGFDCVNLIICICHWQMLREQVQNQGEHQVIFPPIFPGSRSLLASSFDRAAFLSPSKSYKTTCCQNPTTQTPAAPTPERGAPCSLPRQMPLLPHAIQLCAGRIWGHHIQNSYSPPLTTSASLVKLVLLIEIL